GPDDMAARLATATDTLRRVPRRRPRHGIGWCSGIGTIGDEMSDGAPTADTQEAGMVAERSDEEEPDGGVPPAVRALLVEAAADVLGTLDPVLVPVALQRVKAFAPRRRASAGAAPLWRALVDD